MPLTIPSTPFVIPTTMVMPPAPVNNVSATSYTFGLIDAQAYTVFSAATTVTATIPKDIFPIGTQFTCEQSGVGFIAFAPAVGVTFNPTGSRGSLFQFGVTAIFQKQLNVWTFAGSYS